jgi:hypothetical protein
MKSNSGKSREINRISRRVNLPLLRGMFASIRSADKNQRPIERRGNFSFYSEEELILSSEKGYFLGEE